MYPYLNLNFTLYLQIGLYFFTFSARGETDGESMKEYYYERIRKRHGSMQHYEQQTENDMPIVIDNSRNRYYYNPGRNDLDDEWE